MTKVAEKNQNTHFIFNHVLSENRAIYEITSRNIKPDRPQMTEYGACALHGGKALLQARAHKYTPTPEHPHTQHAHTLINI